MKNIIKKIKYWCAWAFSHKVLEAINEGRPYEEVDALVFDIIETRKHT